MKNFNNHAKLTDAGYSEGGSSSQCRGQEHFGPSAGVWVFASDS
jgi:hypothetical protein